MTAHVAAARPLLALSILLVCAATGSLVAQQDARPVKPAYDDGNVEALPVQGNVHLVAGSGANITVQIDPDGVLVVDTSVAAMSEKVLAAIRTISDKPVRHIINTSADEHHTGGNENLSNAGRNVSAGTGGQGGREPPELGVDEPKPPHHVHGVLERTVPQANVLVDGIGARREHDDAVRIPGIPYRQHALQRVVILRGVFRDVGFQRDARALEQDHLAGTVVIRGVAIVRIVQPREVGRDRHRIPARVDVFEDAGVPHALLPLAVRPVVIQVAKLADERALPDSGAADDCDAHAAASVSFAPCGCAFSH